MMERTLLQGEHGGDCFVSEVVAADTGHLYSSFQARSLEVGAEREVKS